METIDQSSEVEYLARYVWHLDDTPRMTALRSALSKFISSSEPVRGQVPDRSLVRAAVEAIESVVVDTVDNECDDVTKWEAYCALDNAGNNHGERWLNYLAALVLASASKQAEWLKPRFIGEAR